MHIVMLVTLLNSLIRLNLVVVGLLLTQDTSMKINVDRTRMRNIKSNINSDVRSGLVHQSQLYNF